MKAAGRVGPPVIQSIHVPAPMGGFNTIDAGGAMPPTDCVYLYNLIGSEYGLRTRLGYREWAINLTGAADNTVRTIIPFTGSAKNGSKNKLFATTSTGIWDVSASGGVVKEAHVVGNSYAVGDIVSHASLHFICTTASDTNETQALPSLWAQSTAYVIGNRVIANGNVYVCDTNGTSDASANGPSGTGANVTDGTTRWDFECVQTEIIDDAGLAVWSYLPGITATTLVHTFASPANNAGRGVWHVAVPTAGTHYLFYADEENGLLVYDEVSGVWAAAGFTGLSMSNVVFFTYWKNRPFLVERDSTNAWYGGTGTISGAVTKFPMASKFKAGGPLVGLWSWTYDGGSGIDDALVAVSQGGDVSVYQGTDISSATTFGLTGTWQVGAIPAGRRIATDAGGDLLLMTGTGILPMSKLVVGGTELAEQQAPTAKISNLFNQQMANYRTRENWSIHMHPTDNALLVCVPSAGEEQNTTQLAMSLATKGWSRYRDLPVYSGGVFDGDFYFGTADGRVCRNIDYIDNVPLAADTFTAVSWSFLSAFHQGNGAYRQVRSVRPVIMSQQQTPPVVVAARYDYDLTEPSEPSGSGSGGSNSWDEALWDSATWSGDYTTYAPILGASGQGRAVAVAVRGKAATRTVLVGTDIHFVQGGPL